MEALDLVSNATLIPNEAKFGLFCDIWRPDWSSDLFFEKVGRITTAELLFRVIQLLPKLKLSDQKFQEIIEQCDSQQSLSAVLHFVASQGTLEKWGPDLINRLLKTDSQVSDMNARIRLYIAVLQDVVGRGIDPGMIPVSDIFAIFADIFELAAEFPQFPFVSSDVLAEWQQHFLAFQGYVQFSPYRDSITRVVGLINRLVCK
jgi:hypothetical protein